MVPGRLRRSARIRRADRPLGPDDDGAAVRPRELGRRHGMLEVDRGTFSIEPFLYVGEGLVTWADGSPTQELEQGFLPIPSCVWRKEGIVLRATAFATGEAGKAVLYIRYRLENLEAQPRHLRFFAALRPFQVTPPWQAFHDFGGVSAIA